MPISYFRIKADLWVILSSSFPPRSYRIHGHLWIASFFSSSPWDLIHMLFTPLLRSLSDLTITLSTYHRSQTYYLFVCVGNDHGASIRLGPWWEMCRVHFASQMLVCILCLWMGKMHEFAYFKVTWILFQTNPIRFYLFNFFFILLVYIWLCSWLLE